MRWSWLPNELVDYLAVFGIDLGDLSEKNKRGDTLLRTVRSFNCIRVILDNPIRSCCRMILKSTVSIVGL